MKGPAVEEAGGPAAAAVEVGGLPVVEEGEPPGEAMVAATAVASCNRAPLPFSAQPPADDHHNFDKCPACSEKSSLENCAQVQQQACLCWDASPQHVQYHRRRPC